MTNGILLVLELSVSVIVVWASWNKQSTRKCNPALPCVRDGVLGGTYKQAQTVREEAEQIFMMGPYKQWKINYKSLNVNNDQFSFV